MNFAYVKISLLILGFVLLFSADMWCNALMPAPEEPDSGSTNKYTWEDVYVTAKAGALVWEIDDNLYPGFAANAGMGLGLGLDFFLKPTVSFWQTKTKGKRTEIQHSIGYMISIEYLMYSDLLNFSVSFGAGSFSINESGDQPGILTEFGLIYPLNNQISIYAGGGYMNILFFDFGGSEKTYNIVTLSAGIYFNLEQR